MHELGRLPSLTKVGSTKLKKIRTRGKNQKTRLLYAGVVNVFDKKTKKYSKAKINSVVDNPASRHFTRRNILTKGAVIETDKGKAKVMSRPGQDGTINAVLIS